MISKRFIALFVFLGLAGCGSWSPNWSSPIKSLNPHKIDIQQGNAIDQEMVSKLKPGMTRSQVRFILGTPLVDDAFHPNRWDYVYRYIKGGTLTEQRRITVLFENDKLKSVDGDVVAAKADTPEGEKK